MNWNNSIASCALGLLFLTLTGCSATQPAMAPQVASEPAQESVIDTGDSVDPEKERMESIYQARLEEARNRFVKADVDFMTGMIGHHAQALIMSAFAPENGASSEVQTLAARIINAQKDEIATMQQWLRDRDQAVPQVHIEGSKLMIHGAGEHHMHHNMPGMLTDQQLKELELAQGVQFDRLFLDYMIQHHMGAVTMVKELFATDGAGQDEASFKLASDIHVDQVTEIERMKLMLSLLPDSE